MNSKSDEIENLKAELAAMTAERDSEQRWANQYHQEAERYRLEADNNYAEAQRIYRDYQLADTTAGVNLARAIKVEAELQQARAMNQRFIEAAERGQDDCDTRLDEYNQIEALLLARQDCKVSESIVEHVQSIASRLDSTIDELLQAREALQEIKDFRELAAWSANRMREIAAAALKSDADE